jgi:hypothetical protein
MGDKDESRRFMKSLYEFWAGKGRTNLKIPQVGGQELDLCHLYKSVCGRGGAEAVSKNKLWKDVVNEFGLPASCTSASYTLRNHYNKYLLAYEQKYFFGKDEEHAIQEVAGSRTRKQLKVDDYQDRDAPAHEMASYNHNMLAYEAPAGSSHGQHSLQVSLENHYQKREGTTGNLPIAAVHADWLLVCRGYVHQEV